MRAWLLVVVLCSCRGDESPAKPVEAPTQAQDQRVPTPPVDVAAIVPKQPGIFGPWAKHPIGTTREEIEKATPTLVKEYEVDARGEPLTVASVTPRFRGVMIDGQLVAYTIVLDAKGIGAVEAAWGPPRQVTDPRGRAHTLWVTADSHLERTASAESTTTLTITRFVPLANYLGKKAFAFEEKRSLVGLPVKDAIAQVTSWAKTRQLPVSVEGGGDALATAIGNATNTSVSADQVVVVGSDGSTTPLSSMPMRSIDVSLPPTEGNFEPIEYNFTRLRIWVDDKGVVSHYWFDLWLDDEGYKSASALLAKAFGKPTKVGESLRYPTKTGVCFPSQPRPYASIGVGDCN
jgi:hypothetical protein